jgi:hypothetical protein
VKYLFYALLLYLAYVFIFRLVIPVFITTRKIKKGFRDMQARMQEQQQAWEEAQSGRTHRPAETPRTGKAGDYIEFEEVK